MLDIVRARPQERVLDFPSLDDLHELLEPEESQAAVCIWQTSAGQPVGYSALYQGETFCSLLFEAQPGLENAGELEDEMITWGERAFGEYYRGQAAELNANAFDHQTGRIRRLEAHGFICQADSVITMTRDLAEPIETPRLPEGFIIRALAVGEAPAWVALHQAAFGTHNTTVENRQSMINLPDYDPELDLVAVAPDGTLAAYVFGSYSREENALSGQLTGYTDPVATHPRYQRLGLSRALLLTALRLLKARGMEIARLGTSSENLPMQLTAQSVGFRVSKRAWIYEKPMARPTNASKTDWET